MTFNLPRAMNARVLKEAALLLAASIVLLAGYWLCEPMRSSIRWLFWSRDYKAEMAKRPAEASAQLKHVVWDSWGWARAGDTVVYLVFDPRDSLPINGSAHASPGGLPCEVDRIHRLEPGWYSVLFYSDTDWDSCPVVDSGRLQSRAAMRSASW